MSISSMISALGRTLALGALLLNSMACSPEQIEAQLSEDKMDDKGLFPVFVMEAGGSKHSIDFLKTFVP